MNIHLLPDDKFSDLTVIQFEYYYPNDNIYVAMPIKGESDFMYIKNKKIIKVDFNDKDCLSSLLLYVKLDKIHNVFVHYLDQAKSKLACQLVYKTNCKCYWIFYGGDLYSILYKRKGYRLYDDFRLYDIMYKLYWKLKTLWKIATCDDYFENFIKICDYVCYWDKYDFELLKKYYNVNIQFRYFGYFNPLVSSSNEILSNKTQKQQNLVLVGNNSNRNGNEITILRRLYKLDKNKQLQLLLPMSYGYPSDKNRIIKYLNKYFCNRYTILDKYMPYQDYVELISKANSAIFGQRRQAAGGNIIAVLNKGTKVFLREDNNIMQMLKDERCVVFSFEKDLKDVSILLEPLSENIVKNNKENCKLSNLSLHGDDFMRELFT